MKLLRGLNTDTAHVDQPGSTYRRARNMILDDLAGALSVEKGTIPLDYFDNDFGGQRTSFKDMSIVGSFKVPGDRILMAMKKRDLTAGGAQDERIVEVTQLPAQFGGGDSLTVIAAGPAGTFGWTFDNPVQGVGYVNAAQETILTWTDGVTKPKWINASTYQNGDEPNLVFPEARFPMTRPISFAAVQQNGSIYGGTWSFMLAYEVVDNTNNITQYGPSIGAFRIGNVSTDENAKFDTNIGLKFYGLDTQYNYVRIYGIRNYNGVETVHYCDRLRITGEDLAWEYLGQEEDATNVPATDELFIPRANYTSAETIAVSDDRLFMANLTGAAITKDEGRTIANQITMHWTVDQSGQNSTTWDSIQSGGTVNRVRNITSDYFVDAVPKRTSSNNNDNFRHEQIKLSGMHSDDHYGLLGGFMPDSVYAFYIAFLMKDGTWSNAFHIPASGTAGTYPAAATGFASVSLADFDIEEGAGVHNLKVNGRTGWVSNASENYPSDYTQGVVSTNLANNPVRHHRMPTVDQMYQATRTSLGGFDDLNAGDVFGTYTEEWANSHLGVFASNVVIDADVAAKIQGYKIFYAKAGVNERRVKSYSPCWAWHRYANLDPSDSLYGTQNISVNALRIYDPYLIQQKPGDVDDWEVTEVYKNMAFLSSPLTGQNGYQTSGVSNFEYLPNNVQSSGFDNRLRESVMAIALDTSPTDANGWMAAWPGYFPGSSVQWANATAHGTTAPLWQGQPAYDAIAPYTKRTTSEHGHGANFASSFGSAHRSFSSDPWSATNAPADKSSPFYGTTFAQAGAGAWKNPADNTAGVTGLRYIGPGNMMSYVQLACDYNNYFENYAGQELVATNDLKHIDGAGTYYNNQAVLGGDTFITPVVVEFMAHRVGYDPDVEPINEQSNDGAGNYHNCELGKISYFTYSYLPTETQDLRETENLPYFGAFSSSFGSSTVENFFDGQFLNDAVFGAHYYKVDDNKSAFPFNRAQLAVNDFPNRIIRSAKQGYETTQYAWNAFAPADYYDNALAKEQIRNLEDYKGELIIHHQNAIFKTRSKFNFDASGTDVFVGTGDIFQAPPMELFPDAAGYAGISHWADSLLCRAGYVWVDREGRKVYMLGQGLEELSANGMRDYFRDDFCQIASPEARITDTTDGGGGYAIGYDPQYDRLMVTGLAWTEDGTTHTKAGETLSYSLRNQCWSSMHDRLPQMYFQSYSNLYMLDEYNMRSYDTTNTNQFVMVYRMNNGNQGSCAPYYFPFTGVMPSPVDIPNMTGEATPTTKSFVDVVFNMGGARPKVWQNFNWITRSGEGEGELLDGQFDNFTVYNDYQISDTATSTDVRTVDNRSNFNNFRDMATGSGTFFEADGFTFDATRVDNTKAWYDQGRFISEYAIIRLETLNTTGDSLYLTDVSATARAARR